MPDKHDMMIIPVILVVISYVIQNVSSTVVSNDGHRFYFENLLTANINFTRLAIPEAKVTPIRTPTPTPTPTTTRRIVKGITSEITNIPADVIAKSNTIQVFSHHRQQEHNDFSSRKRRNASSSFEEDEIGWTNINEEVDMALKTIWPQFIEQGYTTLALPDLDDSISVKPLLITYSAGLRLFNGHLYNIEGLIRSGDAYMTYIDRSFQFRLKLVIPRQQFMYDFIVNILGIEIGGTVNGFLEHTIVRGDFSVRAKDANMKLNDFKVLSFGNLGISLRQSKIIQQLSSIILRPITNYFNERLTTSISEAIRIQLQNLMEDINNNDTLQLKQLLKNMLSGLIGNKE